MGCADSQVAWRLLALLASGSSGHPAPSYWLPVSSLSCLVFAFNISGGETESLPGRQLGQPLNVPRPALQPGMRTVGLRAPTLHLGRAKFEAQPHHTQAMPWVTTGSSHRISIPLP